MRLIDADKFIEWLDIGHLRSPSEICFSEGDVKVMIDIQPTIEAVPVVRCKDCKYRTWFCPGYGCGNYNSPFYIGADEEVPIMTKPDDFCSYGEKKIDRKKV